MQHYLTVGLLTDLLALSSFRSAALLLPVPFLPSTAAPRPPSASNNRYGRLRPVGSPEPFAFLLFALIQPPSHTHTLTAAHTSAHSQVSHDVIIETGREYLG